jgi:predicted alpha/beta hydrolase family esterase
MNFKSQVFILPGLGNSGDQHWQTLWEQRFPEFQRIQQASWNFPSCEDWITTIDDAIMRVKTGQVILVAHSLACCTVGYWVKKYDRKIKGALLVAPSDTEAPSYPLGTTGFTPMPMVKLPFPSITVISTNDQYVSLGRAKTFAEAWGSELVIVGDVGHINAASQLGYWNAGLELLVRLDR